MNRFKKFLIIIGLLGMAGSAAAQDFPLALQQFVDYCQKQTPVGYSPKLDVLMLTPKSNLHYLFPFYNALHDEAKFKQIYGEKGYYDELSQYFAFAGDYLSALKYLEKSYDSVDDRTRKKVYRTAEDLKDMNIKHVNARLYINFAAKTHRVVMINEAFSKPLHRAFTKSLLEDLYKQGFRYLAMEMLNNFPDRQLSRETMLTGYYAGEPVAGELIRSALAMGWKLVPYEDTAAASHTANQRDSAQAANIYAIIRNDSSAKILVHASYGHISKIAEADGHIPMALAFWRLSGINPLTIDQTDMTEGGNFGYGRVIYQAYIQKYSLTEPSIALVDNAPINVIDKDRYDLCVIHPPSIYQDGRPNWYNLGGTRLPTYVKPTGPQVFLVQAYYETEIDNNDNTPWQLVPADQTYLMGSGKKYLLWLKRGKYKIYYRDMNYHILGTLSIEVN